MTIVIASLYGIHENGYYPHFTTNTFREKAGDYGDESPSISDTTTFDADQWIKLVTI
jgi:hypothetical protein